MAMAIMIISHEYQPHFCSPPSAHRRRLRLATSMAHEPVFKEVPTSQYAKLLFQQMMVPKGVAETVGADADADLDLPTMRATATSTEVMNRIAVSGSVVDDEEEGLPRSSVPESCIKPNAEGKPGVNGRHSQPCCAERAFLMRLLVIGC